MTWGWRSEKSTSVHEPNPADYTCCCGGCSSKVGFIGFTLFSFVLTSAYNGLEIGAKISEGFAPKLECILPLVFEVVLLVPFFFALKTRKPLFMQIIWIYRLIVAVLVGSFFLFVIGVGAYSLVFEERESNKSIGLLFIIVSLISCAFLAPYHGWGLYVTYRHYANLRDTRIWMNQQWSMKNIEAQPINPKPKVDPIYLKQ